MSFFSEVTFVLQVAHLNRTDEKMLSRRILTFQTIFHTQGECVVLEAIPYNSSQDQNKEKNG